MPGKFSLLTLLHPDCPCSQASVTELGRLMAQLHGSLAADIVFVNPGLRTQNIQTASLWKRAAAMLDAAVFNDGLGRETALFGGAVSGEAMLYDPQGKLMFHGGITASRGHEGDNPGSDSIRALVRGETHTAATHPHIWLLAARSRWASAQRRPCVGETMTAGALVAVVFKRADDFYKLTANSSIAGPTSYLPG